MTISSNKSVRGTSDQDLRIIKTMLKEVEPATLQEAEALVFSSFGGDYPLGRTPLLQACREGDRSVIDALLQPRCKLGQADLFGFTELEICFEVGGTELLRYFADTCKARELKPVINERLIRLLIAIPDQLTCLLPFCQLNASAKRQLLCLYCALLDEPGIRALLATGLDINKTLTKKSHALYEACTSYLLWEQQHPDYLTLAYRYTKANGLPGSHSLHIDNRLIKGDNFGQLFAQAQQRQKELQQQHAQLSIPKDLLAAQDTKRLSIIHLLLDAGLDPQLAEKKRPDFFVKNLVELNCPTLLANLRQLGFSLEPEEYEIDCMSKQNIQLLDKLKQ